MTDPASTADQSDLTLHRLAIEHSVYYAVQEPAETRDERPVLLIAAHGYGQSARSFLRQFAFLRSENVLVAAPQAPNQFYWQDTGKVGFCWMTRFGRENSIPDLMHYMRRFLGDLHERHPFDENRVFILGFSQGSALAFRLGAEGILTPRGVIACGGDLPPDVAERLDEVEKFPVLVVHGNDDSTMSFAKAQEGEGILRAHGFEVTAHYFDGAHDLPQPVLDFIYNWMQEREA